MSKKPSEKKPAKEYTTPSLLEPESRGGDIAEGGFDFQDGMILAKIPEWLSCEGFESFIRESIGDVESRWFDPKRGGFIDAIEAKNHHITPAPFWDEIDRFKAIARAGGYRRFTLACASLADDISAIAEAMRRLQGPQSFHGTDSLVQGNSITDFVNLIVARGKTEADATFLLERVSIEGHWSRNRESAEAMFSHAANKHLPGFIDLPGRKVQAVFNGLVALVKKRLNQPISRREVEDVICTYLEDQTFFRSRRVLLQTITPTFAGSDTALRLEWGEFFGGEGRTYPATDAWQQTVVEQARKTRNWIAANRIERRITLEGERRLSTSVAIGSQFPAVSGFTIEVNHRGELWSTDSHALAADSYELKEIHQGSTGTELVVGIGVPRDIQAAVEQACVQHSLSHCPQTFLFGAQPLTSDRQANRLVQMVKQIIQTKLQESGAARIHLFLAVPSPVALFLGHRLNATAEIICYEWTNSSYVPTCRLSS